MRIAWGIVLVVLSLLCWGGQLIVWFSPARGERLSLVEAEDDVEPAFWADVRGEALWDIATLWTLFVAGILLIADTDAWAYFGLVGGGMYVYFAGRGILTRREMLRRGLRIGAPGNIRIGRLFLAMWGVAGLITIVAAATAISEW